MPTLMLYVLVIALAAWLIILARRADVAGPEQGTKFDALAGWTATILFWAAAAVFAAICIALESYASIPAMVILACAVTYFFGRKRAA